MNGDILILFILYILFISGLSGLGCKVTVILKICVSNRSTCRFCHNAFFNSSAIKRNNPGANRRVLQKNAKVTIDSRKKMTLRAWRVEA